MADLAATESNGAAVRDDVENGTAAIKKTGELLSVALERYREIACEICSLGQVDLDRQGLSLDETEVKITSVDLDGDRSPFPWLSTLVR